MYTIQYKEDIRCYVILSKGRIVDYFRTYEGAERYINYLVTGK